MHDLNLACRYADHLIAMRDGEISGQGSPTEVITPDTMQEVFGMNSVIINDPVSNTPDGDSDRSLPLCRRRTSRAS